MRNAPGGPPSPAAWKHEAPLLPDHFVARERLLNKINEAVGRHRASGDVLLVSAPPGFGKSTLLAHWAMNAGMPVMWYHLNADDDDPAALLYGLVRALRTKLPRGRWNVKSLLANLHADALTPAEARRAGDVLAEDIRRHVSRPMTLILTGIGDLGAHGGARIVLEKLLTRTPDHLRLVIELREVPALRVSPLLLQQRVKGVGLEDLQFTADELGALVDRLGVAADAAYFANLEDLCAGWVTGVLLATGALWPECLASRTSDYVHRDAVFGYLASEVIDRLPVALRDFATRAAVLNYMTAPLCAELLHTADARQRLGEIERRTGFVTHVGRPPSEPVYRFQPLLRQALLDRLHTTMTDDAQVRALHVRAGKLLERLGEYDEAVQQYAAAEDFEALVELIDGQRGRLQRAGRGETLVRWLDLVPAPLREERPHLQALLAELHRLAGHTAEAYEAVQRACARLLPPTDAQRVHAARALTTRADVLFTLGRYEEARADCEEALRLAPENADEVHIQAHFTLAACWNNLRGPAAASERLGDLEQRCKRLGDIWALGRLNYMRSNLSLARGAYVQAEREAATGLLYAEEAQDELRMLVCRLNLGGIRQYLGKLAPARADLESALAQSEAIGHLQGHVYALANLADLELTRGAYAAALEVYDQALTLEQRVDDLHLRVLLATVAGYALTLQGHPDQAATRLEALRREITSPEDALDHALVETALGFAYYHQGRLAEARTTLTQVYEHMRAQARYAESARAQLMLAAVLHAEQRDEEATAALGELLDLSATIDDGPTLLYDARLVPALIPELEAMEHPVARALLAQLTGESGEESRGTASELAAANADTPANTPREAIRAYALDDGQVEIGDQRVTSWARPQMRELLFFLLDQAEPVRKRVILETIWPEKDGKLADDEFRRTRSEVKKLIGRPWLEQKDGRWRVTLPYWLDVHAFERLAHEGERLASQGQISAAAVVLRQALRTWSGGFLEGADSEWVELRREDLEHRRLDVVERLAELEITLRHYADAAPLCREVLEKDPYREGAYRGLMTCYVVAGEPVKAMAQYKRCVDILREDIGVAPDPRTVKLGEKIRTMLRTAAHAISTAR